MFTATNVFSQAKISQDPHLLEKELSSCLNYLRRDCINFLYSLSLVPKKCNNRYVMPDSSQICGEIYFN